MSSRTRAASAWPRVAFMTAPTRTPTAWVLPPRILATTSGLAAIASSTAWARAPSSLTTARPRASTISSGPPSPADARKWWLGELSRRAHDTGTELTALPITPAQVARVAELVAAGTLNDKLARQVIDAVLAGQGSPDEVVGTRGLAVVSDESVLTRAIDELAAAASAGDDAELAAQLASIWAMIAAVDPELAARAERYSSS